MNFDVRFEVNKYEKAKSNITNYTITNIFKLSKRQNKQKQNKLLFCNKSK